MELSLGRVELGPGSAPPVAASEYEAILERAMDHVEKRLQIVASERTEAARMYLLLAGRRRLQRELLLHNHPLSRGLCLAILLIEESHRRSYEDSFESLEHAEMATRIAGRLDPQRYGASLVAEISARAWAALGNASRLVGRLGRAEEAFQQARGDLDKGSGEPLERGLVWELEAALHATRGRWDEADRLLASAAHLFGQVRDRHLEGRVRAKHGILALLGGSREAAVGRLTHGLRHLIGEREPYVAAAGQALLAALLASLADLPAQVRAREALWQARHWLGWPRAQPARPLVSRVEALLLRGAPVGGSGVPAEVMRLVPTWPRRL